MLNYKTINLASITGENKRPDNLIRSIRFEVLNYVFVRFNYASATSSSGSFTSL